MPSPMAWSANQQPCPLLVCIRVWLPLIDFWWSWTSHLYVWSSHGIWHFRITSHYHAITVKSNWIWCMHNNLEVSKESPQPNDFVSCRWSCNIFSFHCWECRYWLLLPTLRDNTYSEQECICRSRFVLVQIAVKFTSVYLWSHKSNPSYS